MMRRVLPVCLSAVLVCLPAAGDVALPALFTDHAVFQQGIAIPVWGTAGPGEEVTVAFAGQKRTTKADDKGRWMVRLDAVKATAEPQTLTVVGKNKLEVRDILVGEVWVGSGQSNMEMSVAGCINAAEEIAAANYPQIRLITVPKKTAGEPQADFAGKWTPCSPETVRGFSGVAYFFGRRLHKELGVPVGLIHSSWGGSPAEPWTPRAAFEAEPALTPIFRQFQDKVVAWRDRREEVLKAHEEAVKSYRAGLLRIVQAIYADDLGTKEGWEKPDLKADGWQEMNLPGQWERIVPDLRSFDGVVWFRKELDIPAAWTGKDLALELGPVDDEDATFFNGAKVGATGYEADNPARLARKYVVPGRLVRGGKAVLAVRVLDGSGGGGLTGTPAQMKLAPGGSPSGQPISLAGPWRYKVGCTLKPGRFPRPPAAPSDPATGFGSPCAMYNAMIAPLVPYAIAGTIWYQGESNAGNAMLYRKLFPALIRGWRQEWRQGDFPFLFVQLANFMKPPAEPEEHGWAELREAQLMTLAAVPNTGMAVIIDIGEANDIHPKNKQDVGVRLALWALARHYGRQQVYSGPLYESMKVEGDKVRLTFQHVGGGLVARGGKLRHFAIAGEDRKFVWAEARIEGDAVVVWSDQVARPAAVRYAWAANPEGCNLYNREGLPASPFRTDDWPKPPPKP